MPVLRIKPERLLIGQPATYFARQARACCASGQSYTKTFPSANVQDSSRSSASSCSRSWAPSAAMNSLDLDSSKLTKAEQRRRAYNLVLCGLAVGHCVREVVGIEFAADAFPLHQNRPVRHCSAAGFRRDLFGGEEFLVGHNPSGKLTRANSPCSLRAAAS